MKRVRRCTRIFILSLLVISVFVPIFFLSGELKHSTKEFIEDLSTIKIRKDSLKLNALGEKVGERLRIPTLVVYKNVKVDPATVLHSSDENTTLEEYGRNEDNDYLSQSRESNSDAKEVNHQSQPGEINSTISSSETNPNAQGGNQQIEPEELNSNISSSETNPDAQGGNQQTQSEEINSNISSSETNPDAQGGNQQTRPEEINSNISSSETNPDAQGGNQQIRPEKVLSTSGVKEYINETGVQPDRMVQSQSRKNMDVKIKEMKDQLTRGRAYLNFAQPDNNSHLIKELKTRIKELKLAMGEATKDSDLSKRALQRMRGMEITLSKAKRIYGGCSTMTKKLRAMTSNAEEIVRTQKNEATFLVKLAARTTPKGLHCLSMRLTAEYFALKPEDRELPSHHQLHDSDLHHFVVFSDNVLACAAVVDSTVSTALEPERIVFHVVTDSLNFAAISMWFLLNPPKKATLQIHTMDKFKWLSSKYEAAITQGHDSLDPRYTSMLNHLRFYLPDIFPKLDKIVLLDHDVIVQRDLASLWNIDLKGKVNGAVETCQQQEHSFRRMDMLVNFSDPMVARRFNAKACTWAFGVNVFDLKEWRRRNLTGTYLKYLQMGNKRPLWKAGSLPIGLITFYNQTTALDKRWHVYGLGYHTNVSEEDIEQAAVLHYDGVMKPWLDIGLDKYKKYWTKHINYEHPYLQQCNIHE